MTNLYNLYYNKDVKEALEVETKKYFNRVFKKNEYCVKITKADAIVTYHFDKATNKIVSRFVDEK